MDFEILASSKHFAAWLERAGEGLLAGVHADMVDQLVLCLEWLAIAAALLPEAGVVCTLGPADVINRYVRHDFLHCWELFQTGRAVFELLACLSGQQGLCVDRSLRCSRRRSRIHAGQVAASLVLVHVTLLMVEIASLRVVASVLLVIRGCCARGPKIRGRGCNRHARRRTSPRRSSLASLVSVRIVVLLARGGRGSCCSRCSLGGRELSLLLLLEFGW